MDRKSIKLDSSLLFLFVFRIFKSLLEPRSHLGPWIYNQLTLMHQSSVMIGQFGGYLLE